MGIGAGIRKVMLGALAASSLFAAGRIVDAQVVTGTLGQPSATTTIKGNQIPTSPLPFGGVIKENATASTPGGRRAWCRLKVRRMSCSS
jgi:hypothetical protein